MAYTAPWDETAPLGDATQASDIDLLFRQLKRDLRERIAELVIDFTVDPVRPKIKLLGMFTTTVGTGASTGTVQLRAVTVPANAMGPNGALRITVGFKITGAAGTKTLRLDFGAGSLYVDTWAAGETIHGIAEFFIYNKGATNSQEVFCHATASDNTGLQHSGVNGGSETTAQDTTVAQDVAISGQTANAADEVECTFFIVELLRAA